MPMCQRKTSDPSYPKLLGWSQPKGQTMTLKDLGPNQNGDAGRYVLSVNSEETPFDDMTQALKAWTHEFQSLITPQM